MSSKPFYEPGSYVGEVTAQALGKAQTGTPQFVLRFRVLGRPDPKDSTNYIPVQEYERTMYRAITQKTVEFVVEDLNQLGWSGTSFGTLDPSHPQHQSFVGRQFDFYCKHEPDQQGGLREKWQLSRGAPTLKIDPLDARGVRELDSLFGRAVKTAAAPASQQRTAPQSRQPSQPDATTYGVTDDDIPF